jgi:putative ABC transport system permease protein
MLYTTRRDRAGDVRNLRWSWKRIGLLRQFATSFSDLGSVSIGTVTLSDDAPEPITIEIATAGYFQALRVPALAGRPFLSREDDGEGAHPVVLLSHDLWTRRFGGDERIVGRTVHLNGVPLTIVGVLPAGFNGISGRAELWIPPSMAPPLTYSGYLTTNQDFIGVVARLAPGVSQAHAQRELALVAANVQQLAPSTADEPDDHFGATCILLNEARVNPTTRRAVLFLFGATGFLLLLACTNVAILLIGRGLSRRKEIAIRVAVGASRWRIIGQLLAESLALAAAAAAIGTLASAWLAPLLPIPADAARTLGSWSVVGEFAAPRVDLHVLAFVIMLVMLTSVGFGLAPAMKATRVDLTSALKEGTTGGGVSRRSIDLRQVLLVGELCLAVVLLTGAGLMLSSYRRLQQTPLGFDHDRLITFLLRPSEVKYPPAKAPALIDRVLAEIRVLPGVDAATVDACTPLGQCASSTLYVIGRPAPRPEDAPFVLRHYVAPDHFRTLGIPLLRGRAFTGRDRAGAPRVAIINEAAARRFFPGENPIGQRVWFDGGSSFDRPDSSAEIVGIVGDVPYQALDHDPVQADFYTPYAQFTFASRMVIVRTNVSSAVMPAIRRALRRADPDLVPLDVQTMIERAEASWSRQSYVSALLASFGAVALLLAAIGVFAVVANAASERRREIGIRTALGARARDVLATVVGRTAILAVAGLTLGLLLAIALSRTIQSLLYQTRPIDPIVMVAVVLVLGAAVGIASWLPARKALRADPLEALRVD